MTRIATGACSCRDLASLAQGAQALPEIRKLLGEMDASLLAVLHEQLDPLEDLTERISATIVDEPPLLVREGRHDPCGCERRGRPAPRRAVRRKATCSQKIEADEKEKTGIRNLRVGYNRVFGYYIEVAKGQVDLVPDTYIRKQTLSTGERYITEELKELENTILTAKTGWLRWNTTCSASCGTSSRHRHSASSRRRRPSRRSTCSARWPPSP